MVEHTANPDARAHWQGVYERREPDEVSWYEPLPARSLEWIERTGAPHDAAILDAGGGASALAAQLLARGYTDVTVADISKTALDRAAARLGPDSRRVAWLEADLRTHEFARRYDVWHDRAVLHFMVDTADRDRYLATLTAAIRPGGHLVLATFGPDGPARCSGLPVQRYAADEIAALLAPRFELRGAQLAPHRTPSGSVQQFLYALLQCT